MPVMNKLHLILLFVLFSASLFAQNVQELNSFLAEAKKTNDPAIMSEAKHLESLIRDLQPTVYINNMSIENNEAQPVCAEVDASSVDQLSLQNELFIKVEIITIRLQSPSDLDFILDLSILTGFTNLKFVVFLCEFECTDKDIDKIFLTKSGITVFYKVSIPS